MAASRNVWGELQSVCAVLHKLMYEDRDIHAAGMRLPALEALLQSLPHSDDAILLAEALALKHELRGERTLAIQYRRREIELMKRLYEDIRVNEYSDEVKKALLAGRDDSVMKARLEIIDALEQPSHGEAGPAVSRTE